jgi:hypothetical protein
MSEEKPTPSSGKELDDVRKELREWKRQHPKKPWRKSNEKR